MRYIILLLFFVNSLNSMIIVSPEKNEINLLEGSEVYYDLGAKENIGTLLSNSKKFNPLQAKFLNYGYKSKNVVWIKFTLYNPSSKVIERKISIDNTFIETIELYRVENSKIIEHSITGLLHQNENATFMHKLPIVISSNVKQEYYMRLSSNNTSLNFTLTLLNDKIFIKQDRTRHIVWALFFGALMAMIIYNIFLFIFTKHSVYFYYLLYLFSIILTGNLYFGLIISTAPEESLHYIKLKDSLSIYVANFITLSIAFFTREFLQTKQYPKIDLIIKVLITMLIIHSLVTSPDVLPQKDISFCYIGFLLIIFCIGNYAFLKGNKQARYFLIGWTFAILGWLSILLHDLAIWNVKFMFYYIFEVLVMAEVLLFSISLASRIKHLCYQKNELIQKLLLQKENETKHLEEIVKERTKTLQVELKNNELLLKELHHRVKNNMQFIASLYALKLDSNANSITDSKLREKLRDIERKIYAMSEVHEMLYSQKKLDNIDAKSYLEKVLYSIKNAFQTEDILFHLCVDTTLDAEEAIYCGLIINELVTNAVKYAFDEKGGRIEIELKPHGAHTLLRVCDNGRGITKCDKETFGMMMIKTLVEEQLEGKLSIKNKKGAEVSIIF